MDKNILEVLVTIAEALQGIEQNLDIIASEIVEAGKPEDGVIDINDLIGLTK